MQIRISGPEEGTTMRGYISGEILQKGDLLAEAHVAPDALDDLLGDDLVEDLRGLADAVEALREADR